MPGDQHHAEHDRADGRPKRREGRLLIPALYARCSRVRAVPNAMPATRRCRDVTPRPRTAASEQGATLQARGQGEDHGPSVRPATTAAVQRAERPVPAATDACAPGPPPGLDGRRPGGMLRVNGSGVRFDREAGCASSGFAVASGSSASWGRVPSVLDTWPVPVDAAMRRRGDHERLTGPGARRRHRVRTAVDSTAGPARRNAARRRPRRRSLSLVLRSVPDRRTPMPRTTTTGSVSTGHTGGAGPRRALGGHPRSLGRLCR